MDKRELNNRLSEFKKACADNNYPINDYKLKPAYPGVDGTSYYIEVKAPWIAKTSLYKAIANLTDILYDTTDEETRRSVFAIKILDY